MAIAMTTVPMQLSKASPAFVIRKPNQIENAYTITSESEAADTLSLTGDDQIGQLKEFLKATT